MNDDSGMKKLLLGKSIRQLFHQTTYLYYIIFMKMRKVTLLEYLIRTAIFIPNISRHNS